VFGSGGLSVESKNYRSDEAKPGAGKIWDCGRLLHSAGHLPVRGLQETDSGIVILGREFSAVVGMFA